MEQQYRAGVILSFNPSTPVSFTEKEKERCHSSRIRLITPQGLFYPMFQETVKHLMKW